MSADSLSQLSVVRKTGNEPFHANGDVLSFDLLSFWQWSASDLTSNVLRGRLAEYLVAKALGITCVVRAEWDAYDLYCPDGTTIEVKSAAYIQTWTQRKLSAVQFDIAPTRFWDTASNEFEAIARRQADIYVFALLAHQEKATIDPMNVNQWRFFVLSAKVLNAQIPLQKSIRLSRLLELGARESHYSQLPSEIVQMKESLP